VTAPTSCRARRAEAHINETRTRLILRCRHSGRRAAAAAVLFALAVCVSVAAAFTEPHVGGNFDRSGVVVKSGRAVRVSGPMSCRAGGTVRLRATISQRATGAVAEGSWSRPRTGKTQHWHITANATDGADLKAGCAHGAGLAIYRYAGRPVDATQWLNALTLTVVHGARGAAIRC
jgi:hypothetical protein